MGPAGDMAVSLIVAAVVDVVAVVVVIFSFLRSATTQFRPHFQVPERIFWPHIWEMCQL